MANLTTVWEPDHPIFFLVWSWSGVLVFFKILILRNLNNAGIKGAIIGKAIYENRVTVKGAVDEFEK